MELGKCCSRVNLDGLLDTIDTSPNFMQDKKISVEIPNPNPKTNFKSP
jgi:hypothetical protein